jgi:toxin FitB
VRGWLLDTNILSELRRPRPDLQVVTFVASQPAARLFVSRVTLAEIRFGIERVADPERRADLSVWLTHTLRPLFEGRVVPITEDVLLRWRHLVEAGRRRGHTYSEPDVFIAAAAQVEQLIVVSRDVRDLSRHGCRCSIPGRGYSPPLASRSRPLRELIARTSSM